MSDNKNGKFWKNQVKVFHFEALDSLEKELNKFNESEFVIATQIYPLMREGYHWVAIVYYKKPPEA